DFSYDVDFGRCDCVIIAEEDGVLELSTEWTNPDGTSGGSMMFFRRGELDERGRRLYEAELEQLTDSLRYEENGFFVCTYGRPEEIDWHQVCYNGAGIGIEPDAEVRAAYEAACGEIETDLEAIYDTDLRNFVWEKTQTNYSEARRPLSLDWVYLDDLGLWFWQHGDTNAQSISFTDGYANGYEYYLYYTRADYESFMGEREFVMHCYIRDGEWQYISNLPADATAPVTLLNIDYYDTKEEAQARGAKEFIEVEQQPWDEDYGWSWAVVTAQTDNVRYIVDRSADPDCYELYGVFVPGDNITSGVLNDGESFAIYINQPWSPDVRLTATKDEYWGEYAFGEDNWLGFDNSVRRYVTGHDLQGEGRGCYPEDESQMSRFLADGSWVYLDEDPGAVTASLRFYGYNSLTITTADESYPIYVRFGYSEDWISGAPDLLALEKDDYNNIHDWSALPDWYTSDDLGDYAVFALQLDGEQILYLTQANNGDGALSWLLPCADENTYEFMLHRYRGTALFEGQG
ncbi:MAG: hypothetical protein IJ049_03190, partial [Oscillospiraceae bacterium]|nr:hypothetical protein [Oscillospiraceae bacterium]